MACGGVGLEPALPSLALPLARALVDIHRAVAPQDVGRHLCFALVIRGDGDQDSAAAYALGVVMRILVGYAKAGQAANQAARNRAQARAGKRCGDGAGGDDRADARDCEWRERKRKARDAADRRAGAGSGKRARGHVTAFALHVSAARNDLLLVRHEADIVALDAPCDEVLDHVLRFPQVVEKPDHCLRHLCISLRLKLR